MLKCRIQLANLPPELSGSAIRTALVPYRDIQSMHYENWSKSYRYAVSTGKLVVTMTLYKHLPSYVPIVGHRELTCYEGQHQVCYTCDETGHMYQVCPKCRGVKHHMTNRPN
jgi:hypothetical protein